MAIGSLFLQLRFVLRSDATYLALGHVQDDSFYYLVPAWNFWRYHAFTSDGAGSTYGFQPLWMLICTALAYVSSTREMLLRLMLCAGALLFTLMGYLIYRLVFRIGGPIAALLSAGLVFFNPPLFEIMVAGKENALTGALVVALLLYGEKLLRADADQAWLRNASWLGVLSGLLTLARFNNLLLLAVFFGLLSAVRSRWRLPSTAMLLVALGSSAAVAGPWYCLAYREFGQLMPSSGTVKLGAGFWGRILIGAAGSDQLGLGPVSAALMGTARAVELHLLHAVPGEVLGWWYEIVRVSWRAVVERPYFLLCKTLFGLWCLAALSGMWNWIRRRPRAHTPRFLAGTVGAVAAGAFGWNLLEPSERAGRYFWLKIGVFGLLFIVLSSVFRTGRRDPALSWRSLDHRWLVLLIILMLALTNAVVNAAFLEAWLAYASWYATFEIVALIVICGCLLDLGCQDELLHDLYGFLRARRQIWIGFCCALFLPLAAHLWVGMAPRTLQQLPSNKHYLLDGIREVRRSVPESDRIAAWNSGYLAYTLSEYHITNLDGLNATPDYVRRVLPASRRFRVGESPTNAIWDFLRERQIRWIADYCVPPTASPSQLLCDVVPAAQSRMIYMDDEAVTWAGQSHFLLIELLY